MGEPNGSIPTTSWINIRDLALVAASISNPNRVVLRMGPIVIEINPEGKKGLLGYDIQPTLNNTKFFLVKCKNTKAEMRELIIETLDIQCDYDTYMEIKSLVGEDKIHRYQ